VRSQRRLVVPPAQVRAVRPHRLLRRLALAACDPACPRAGTSVDPVVRAWWGLVLQLRRWAALWGARPCSAAISPGRAAGARSARSRARWLAVTPALV